MRTHAAMLTAIFWLTVWLSACGGGYGGGGGGSTPAAAPTISPVAAQNSAQIVSLASATPNAVVYYTVDSSTPTTASQIYQAPFLVASNLTVKAMAAAGGYSNSAVTSHAFTPNIPSGTLVWSDEFTNTSGTVLPPNPTTWTSDTGNSGFGNNELETYCAW